MGRPTPARCASLSTSNCAPSRRNVQANHSATASASLPPNPAPRNGSSRSAERRAAPRSSVIAITARRRRLMYPDGRPRNHAPAGGNMSAQTLSLETIEHFLAQKRIAMVGISREPHKLQRRALRRTLPPRLRCHSGKSPHTQCPRPALLCSLAGHSTSRRSRAPHDLTRRYRIGRRRLCRSGRPSGLDVPRRRKWRRQPESNRILPGSRNRGRARPMSLHVSPRRRSCSSTPRFRPQDHRTLSAPPMRLGG
jgi:hypothetical protein